MELENKVLVVTGGASGIGRGLCRRFAASGARAVVVADRDGAGATAVAEEIATPGGAAALAFEVDVSKEDDIGRLVSEVTAQFGGIDLFCSNAGIDVAGGPEVSNEDWRRILDINVMAHVYAARAVLPAWLERGEGYFLNTASAAGLLTMIGSAPYAVTKHAAVSFAEWLAVTYGDQGIKVSCLCPQGVRTGMLNENSGPSFLMENCLEPEDVAEAVVKALAEETFLVLPHPEVGEYFQRKAADYDRWIRGMSRLQKKIAAASS